MYNKFSSLIIDPEMASRGKLRQAAHNVHTFARVLSLSNMEDGISKLQSDHRCDIVFISHNFQVNDIENFIQIAKTTTQGKHCAYILVGKAGSQNKHSVINNVFLGIDGFLFEPFSVDSLREIAEIAAKIKAKNSIERERAAIQLLAETLMGELDHIAKLKARGRDIKMSMLNFAMSCELIRNLNPDALELYYEITLAIHEKHCKARHANCGDETTSELQQTTPTLPDNQN